MASKARQLGSSISAGGALSSTTLPIGTTAQRPASPANGTMRINSTTNTLEIYYSQSWVDISSVLPRFTSEILIVGGGGAGGPGANNARGGGGGGAGAYRSALTFLLKRTVTYTIVVGAGGTTGTVGARTQTNGTASSIFDGSTSELTQSDGGGFGGTAGGTGSSWTSNMTGNFSVNGSGGGGANSGGTGGTNGLYGNPGGTAVDTASNAGAGSGGGGAGTAGSAGTGSAAGAGGSGVANSITGSSVTYAQGGSGATSSVAGSAGGGVNTGAGGAGGQSNAVGSAGQSGIVVIKYPIAEPAATSTTGTVSYTATATHRIYVFTGSGTITF